MALHEVKPARSSDRAYLGFYTDLATKGRVLAVAAHYDISVSTLLDSFARHAEILVWFVDLDRPAEKESRQLAG